MDWSSEEIVKIIYRLLNVKGIGNVQANRWIWSLPHNVQNATQLANNGVCIVSGYANGIDMVAHKTALKNGGDTIIVLPEGIDAFQIKQDLQEVWDWNRVLVISEFLPRDAWMASRAMKRNQTIIALSDVMLVIEAGETGGSLDAGMQTLSFGKPLFVPVFSQIPESARGNELLFAKGARSLKQKKETSRSNIDGLLLAIHHPMTEPELVFD